MTTMTTTQKKKPTMYPLAITATLRRRIPVKTPWKQVTLRYRIRIR